MRALAILSLLSIGFVPAQAQMPWTTNLPQRGVAVDILRPKFRGGGTSLTSVAVYASGRFPIGDMSLRIELPFAHGSTDLDSSSATLGNPYVGLETSRETGLGFEAGARGPLTSETEFAAEIGLSSDITHFEAFLPNTASFTTRVRYRLRETTGFTFDGGGGPSVLIPTKGGGDPELILNYHMSAGYRGTDVWTAIAFGGWTIITEDAGGVGERTIDEIGASVGLVRGQVRPALHVIVPMDDAYNQTVGIVIGFGIAVAVK